MNKGLGMLFALSTAILATVGVSYALSREAEAAAPLQPTYVNPVKPNPNPARELNRTWIKVTDRRYEQVTNEPVPGVICVVVAQNAFGADQQPAISCVTR